MAVVGAGPAGLSFACTAAERGHEVHLFDAAAEIGGQFNMAKQIPGKEEFHETLRYFGRRLDQAGVKIVLGKKVDADFLAQQQFSEVILATGVNPRQIDLPGIDHPKVLSYIEVLREKKPVGKSVALIGAGGIGFDVAEYLSHEGPSPSLDIEVFLEEWGVDQNYQKGGALKAAKPAPSPREIYLLQRRSGKPGKGLGKTTGWIHRSSLKMKKVNMMGGITYRKIDDEGLHITRNGNEEVLAVENIVICAGQVPMRDLQTPLENAGITVHLIGGADEAKELDAKRAIEQGMRVGMEV